MSLLLLFASPPIPALPANQQLKIYGKPINHRHLKSSRVSATRDDVDAFTEKSSYLFKLSSTDADSIVEYDLRKIASVYRRKPLILLRRVFQVGTTFGWWFGSRFVDELMERSDQMFPVRAAELRKILVELGPAYVKIAQAVSSRPDLIPPSYLDELSLLQDQITPFSSEVAFNTIEQELGLPIDELFSEISPEPVAAASLGQVYQARLRQSGRVVAVKVQRPGVQAAISLDIFILHFIAGLIRKARKFNTDLQGQKLSEVKDLYLIEVGVYCSFNQLLEKGFYHADPHPGNLFRSYDGKLAYIDFGMMGEFKEELREGFIEACLHLVNRDFDALAKDFVTLGLLPPTAEKEAVTKALTGVFQNAVAKGVRNISFGDLLGNLGATMYKFKFRIPSYFSLVIRSLAVLEGIAISSNPNYKVLGSTYPYIARKVLTDSSPQLKSSLVALLYKEGVFRIDRLESLLTESLRARTEKALIKKQTEDTDSRLITKEILSFTLTEKGAFVREILLQEFAKGLDALGIATLDYFTSAVIPFAAPFSFSSLTEEDRINLTNLRRLLLLLSRVQSSKSASVEVKEGSIYKNQTTYSEEASLVFYQLASAQEVLPILSVIPELPPELQQEFLHLPADLAGRLISRAAARTIRRMFL
ncbi:putative aarF domain-containing protein kinase [Citrus sinensis]|uniref:AarF domain-containing protein kinase n=1 Tax=Citrus sinensis TaxID=2711 RepID=A0ACB8KU39_CITSI|nr:putative aarF domain-containing protein kinase [Citrus sinensis]